MPRQSALHCGVFCPQDRSDETPNQAFACDPTTFAAFVRPCLPTMASPRSRASRLPEASRGWLAKHIRRRRIPLHLWIASGGALAERDTTAIQESCMKRERRLELSTL